jgi:hypothetical protein
VFENSGGAADIVLYYPEGDASTLSNVPLEEAEHLVDLLRNESPISYDAALRRFSTLNPEPVGEGEVSQDRPLSTIDDWLSANPGVAGAIIWESAAGPEAWQVWPEARKQELRTAFNAAWAETPPALVDPPPNAVTLADTDNVRQVLAEGTAWSLYLGHVAHGLAVELDQRVGWSIRSSPANQLALLFDSRNFFQHTPVGYEITFAHGVATPMPPRAAWTFLRDQHLVGTTRLNTITRVLDWCRTNLVHFLGGWVTRNVEDQWQYRGFPPVSRMAQGTPYTGHPEWGVLERTGGCWGTTGFLRAMLRVLNIPARLETRCGHALPSFPSEGRYLSHGDDPYNQLSRAVPPIPAGELLIAQARFDQWFGAAVPNDQICRNVGRQPRQLSVTYLPTYLLRQHCSDLAAGRSHADSQVFETLRDTFTLAELEAGDLWGRMDAKIASFGGCASLPP